MKIELKAILIIIAIFNFCFSQDVNEDIYDKLKNATLDLDYDRVKEALVSGADPNKIKLKTFDLLTYAVMNKDLEITEILINHGADINRKFMGKDILDWALTGKHSNLPLVKLLIKSGIQPNNRHLYRATKINKVEIVKYLLEFDLDPFARAYDHPNLKDHYPYGIAEAFNYKELIKVFDEYIKAKNKDKTK